MAQTRPTDAQAFLRRCDTAAAVMESFAALEIEGEQDWHAGWTTYTLPDGSQVRVGGADVTTLPAVIPTLQVDASMLGSDFNGLHLGTFCSILQTIVGPDVEIAAVTDSYNGASNDPSDEISEPQWNEALDLFATECPESWDC